MDPDRLTEDELAERSGTSREYIRQLADLGMLQADDRGTFTRQDDLASICCRVGNCQRWLEE